MKINLVATAPMGLEALVAKEIQALGYETTVDNGRIYFEGDELAIVRTNMWVRTADRIKIVVGKFKAVTFEELFSQTKALPWEQYLDANSIFPVAGRSHKSTLFSVPDCQAIVKKAIVERLKEAYQLGGWIDENGARSRIEVILLKDEAMLLLDTSGDALHKRGYRAEQGAAPLKETMAAALILLSNWKGEVPLIDPVCGSGTLAIEAAMIAQNIAPGFNRDFDAENWSWISPDLWEKERQYCEEVADYDKQLEIYASDIDPKMVEIAQKNATEVGFGEVIHFKQMNVLDLTLHTPKGAIVANPPYGERLGEREEVETMYQHLGELIKESPQWSMYILTSYKQFEHLIGKKATKRRKLYNGAIECQYYQYWGER